MIPLSTIKVDVIKEHETSFFESLAKATRVHPKTFISRELSQLRREIFFEKLYGHRSCGPFIFFPARAERSTRGAKALRKFLQLLIFPLLM